MTLVDNRVKWEEFNGVDIIFFPATQKHSSLIESVKKCSYKKNYPDLQKSNRTSLNNERAPKVKTKSWSPLLILTCYATTIGTAVPVGYFLGVMNTISEFVKIWTRETVLLRFNIYISDNGIDIIWASMVSIFLVGGIIGSFMGAWCSDKFGRKGTLLISAFLLLVAGLLLHFCRTADAVEMLLAGRLLAGIASALIYTAHPMYLLEIAPVELRGTVGVFCAAGVTAGIVVGQVLSLEQIFGTLTDWPYALSFYTLLVAICFLPSHWFPESPRWLYLIKRNEKLAAQELYRLRGAQADDIVKKELNDMEMAIKSKATEEDATKNNSYMNILRDPTYLLPLVIVCSFQFCQQLSGINAIFFYSVDIFTKAGFTNSTAAWMNLGAGCLNMVMSLLGPILMAKFNRRPMMLISCTLCGVSLFGVSFALNYIDYANCLPMICIIFTAAFIFFFQFGLGPIPYFIGSELFEVEPRPVAMSIGSLCSWVGNLMIGMGFPLLQGTIGAFAFMPCAVICVYGFLLTWRYLPESRGRDPIDLKPLMANGFKSNVRQ